MDPDRSMEPPSARPDAAAPPPGRLAVRVPLLIMGTLLLGVGLAGVFLPVVPGTPLILLGAACWARGSPRLHQALCSSRLFGPAIRDWQEHRSIGRGAKVTAIAMVIVSFGTSIAFFAEGKAVRATLGVAGICVIAFLWRIPTRKPGSPD